MKGKGCWKLKTSNTENVMKRKGVWVIVCIPEGGSGRHGVGMRDKNAACMHMHVAPYLSCLK